MPDYDCNLTIVAPVALEDALIDELLGHPERVRGFTTAYVEGLGRAVRTHGIAEMVRGRSRRIEIRVVINRQDAAFLVEALKSRLPNPEVAYWVAPILDFGRFA